MPEALPTPYDISGLPQFPYVPGLADWLLVLGIFLAILASIAVGTRLRSRIYPGNPKETALRELMAIPRDSSTPLAPEELFKVSRILRRYCSWILSKDITTASPQEIKRHLNEATTQSARELLQFTLMIEDFKYSPPDARLPLRQLLSQIMGELERCPEPSAQDVRS